MTQLNHLYITSAKKTTFVSLLPKKPPIADSTLWLISTGNAETPRLFYLPTYTACVYCEYPIP